MLSLDLRGTQMPKLGFGTWTLKGDDCVKGVQCALETGYRHIDTAQAYDNEAEVGQGLAGSGVKREDIFLTTKVFRPEFESVFKAMDSIHACLNKLQTDYVDLLLVHWPFPEYEIEQLLAPLMKAQDEGLTRLIGVSNFTLKQMEQALRISDGRVCVNQVEYHPHLNQQPLLDWMQRHGWAMTAYSPLGRGTAMKDDTIAAIADKHGKSPAQITLRWLMQQRQVAAIPKASSPDHIRSNFDIWDFELSDQEMKTISALRAANDRQVNPEWAPRWDVAA